jgi:hypothetical protein
MMQTYCTDKINCSKAVPIIGCEGLYCCEMLRIPHCLDSRLSDGDKFQLRERPRSIPHENFYFCLWKLFLLGAEKAPGPSAAGRTRQADKIQLLLRVSNRWPIGLLHAANHSNYITFIFHLITIIPFGGVTFY